MTDAEKKSWLAGVFDRAAPTYDRIGDQYHDHFGRQLVEAAGVTSGARVLDVACGRGAVLVPAAERAGTAGRLVGVDFSSEMVIAAQAVLAESAEVHVMDAEHLDFADSSFDFVLCSFGVFFFPAPELAVSEMRRVLTRGGVVGLSSWTGEDERWQWEDELLRTLPVERRPISRSFATAEELEHLLTEGGFNEVRSVIERHEVVFADAAQWWDWKWSYSIRGVLEQLDEDARNAYRDAAFAAMASQREPRGLPMRLTAAFTFGRKIG